MAHLISLGLSVMCLFEFGVALLRPFGRARWLRGVPAGLFIAWSVFCFGVLPQLTNDPAAGHILSGQRAERSHV